MKIVCREMSGAITQSRLEEIQKSPQAADVIERYVIASRAKQSRSANLLNDITTNSKGRRVAVRPLAMTSLIIRLAQFYTVFLCRRVCGESVR